MAGMARISLRRTRLNPHIRALTQETRVHPAQLIQPLFVVAGINQREAIPGLDAVFRETPESLLRQIEQDMESGIDKFLLFGVPDKKAKSEFCHDFTCAQIEAVKNRFGAELWLGVDVCLCSHTTHGHCGILNDAGDHVENDQTVEALANAARLYAEAGADCVAPSDMMDGRIKAIRDALDNAGDEQTVIMSYSAKFHSNFYGPFRLAADSAPADDIRLQDRATYQIDPGRPRDAWLSSERDDLEGADILMVKPGLPYLDVLAELSARIPKPWAVYQTSGEQAAIDLLAKNNLIRRDAAQMETWTAFVRAGASMIITYAARRARTCLPR
jgi:porphobilinogen synthase